MTRAHTADSATRDPVELARLHWILRFGTGLSVALVLCEAMGWYPSMLAPVLMAVLHTNLPAAPPFKAGVVLILVMTVSALVAFALSSLLQGRPQILFGVIGVIVFLSLTLMAHGRARVPALLLLLCMGTVPVVAMASPQHANLLPIAMVRGIVIALIVLWGMYALWPRVLPRPRPPEAPPADEPVRSALAGTAIIMPVMLTHLMFGLSDALPVLVTTIMLVTNMDPRRGAVQGFAMVIGNLFGGMIALFAYMLLQIAPSLVTLALITFVGGCAFAIRIQKGGPMAAVALLTCNSAVIIFSLAMLPVGSNAGVWMTRLLHFVIACAFAIGMMSLFWRNSRAAGS